MLISSSPQSLVSPFMVLWSHYSGEVDLMTGISYLLDLVDHGREGGPINQDLTF